MKKLLLALALCAVPRGISAMENMFTLFKEEVVGHKRANTFDQVFRKRLINNVAIKAFWARNY